MAGSAQSWARWQPSSVAASRIAPAKRQVDCGALGEGDRARQRTIGGVVNDAAEPLFALVVSLELGEVGAKSEISIAVTVHADC